MAQKVLGGRDHVRVAVVQAASVFMDKKGCLAKAADKIVEAGREGADLVLFPETWIPTYPYWSMGWDTMAAGFHDVKADLQDNALVVGGEDTDLLGRAAREANAYVVMGCNELDDRAGSRTLFNSLVYLDRQGRVMGRHRKLIPSYIERIWWGRGDARDLKVFDTDPGQEDFVGWACGGSHIVAPTSEYIVPPTFDVETILYADLQAKMIKVVKSVFDALGHYARWDLVSLSGPPEPYEPLTPARQAPIRPREAELEQIAAAVAAEFNLDVGKVEEVTRRLVAAG